MAFDFGSIGNALGGLIESVGEGATTYADAWVKAKATEKAEAAKDPLLLRNAEPDKGTTKDGSTVVAKPVTSNMPFGMDQNMLMIGGGFLLIVMLILFKGGK